MRSFTVQLQEFAAKAKDRADDAVGLIVINIAKRVDERSPVGDASFWKNPPPAGYVGGRFRGSWQLGIGVIPSGPGSIDPTGEATVGRVIASIPKEAAGKVYYLANTTPYGGRIEDGWSRQAPAGVVGLTAMEFETFVRDAAGVAA